MSMAGLPTGASSPLAANMTARNMHEMNSKRQGIGGPAAYTKSRPVVGGQMIAHDNEQQTLPMMPQPGMPQPGMPQPGMPQPGQQGGISDGGPGGWGGIGNPQHPAWGGGNRETAYDPVKRAVPRPGLHPGVRLSGQQPGEPSTAGSSTPIAAPNITKPVVRPPMPGIRPGGKSERLFKITPAGGSGGMTRGMTR